jgi:tetratricopeptide (TPR) repeat protein
MISLVPRVRLLPVLAGGALLLGGCLPTTHSQLDEEKEYHFLAGKSRINGMDYQGAIESFQKALENNPHSASAHFELGWLYDQKESDPAAAIYHYERYLKLRKNADNAEMVRTRILACKQELARTVSLGPVTQTLQRTLEQLAEENRVLKETCAFYSNRLALVSAQVAPPVQAAEGAVPSRSTTPSGVTVAVMTNPGASARSPPPVTSPPVLRQASQLLHQLCGVTPLNQVKLSPPSLAAITSNSAP